MTKHYKNRYDRFSEKLNENVQEHSQSHENNSSDYMLSDNQNVAYVHKRFEGNTKQFYHFFSFFKVTLKTAPKKSWKTFDTKTKQARKWHYFQLLTLISVIQNVSCDINRGEKASKK